MNTIRNLGKVLRGTPYVICTSIPWTLDWHAIAAHGGYYAALAEARLLAKDSDAVYGIYDYTRETWAATVLQYGDGIIVTNYGHGYSEDGFTGGPGDD